ncbi:MAG: response regulator transcription factor [Nitrospiraceae bacterium]
MTPLSATAPESVVTSTHLLLLTANDEWGGTLESYFRRNGYELTIVRSIDQALHRIREQRPACLLVERTLSGLAPLRTAASDAHIPLITMQVSPPHCSEEECLADYAAGSDAVICVGSTRELLARVRAILRREQFRAAAPPRYRAGDIEMDVSRHEVRVRGKAVELTPKEFQLLERLLAAPHHVFTRQELMDQVWGEGYALEPHGVDVHISALRRKVEADPEHPRTIVTVRGHGYKVRAVESQ